MVTISEIARVCHEANRAFCEVNRDYSQVPWNTASPEMHVSSVASVKFAIDNPDATPEEQHDQWCAQKLAAGWKYGAAKDPMAKTHPCLVAYEELPDFQKKKDALFQAIVNALK